MQSNKVVQVRVDGGQVHGVTESPDEESRDTRFSDERKNKGLELREAERQIKDACQQHEKSQQGPVVRWDRFLPQRQLRVLLVEDDDSTRHVVTALLRICSYEVTSAVSGLIAWNMLEDPSNHFDLVLTEVVMPYLSGIGLLCRITTHEASKHIPVIMMSSHDSMGIVFKCLSKGAVDFLVKPVRKNELKNLWQHVWRRCYNSSGSRSGIQIQKHPRGDKSGVGSGNDNTGTSDESDNASGSLNIQDGSDKGSGTQSSWTRRIVEVESPVQRNVWNNAHPHSGPTKELPKPGKAEKFHSDRVQGLVLDEEFHISKNREDHAVVGVHIPTVRVTVVDAMHLNEVKNLHGCVHTVEENTPSRHISEGEQMDIELGGCGDNSTKAIDLIGGIDCQQKDIEKEWDDTVDREDALDEGTANTPKSKDETVSDSNFQPTLELTLKRPHCSGEEDGSGEEKRVLKHSGSSAFSRYNTPGNYSQIPSPRSSPINIYPISSGYAGVHAFMQGSAVGTSDPMAVQFAIPPDRAQPLKDDDAVSVPLPEHPCLLHDNEKEETNLATVGPEQDGTGAVAVKEEAVPVPPLLGSGMPMLIPFPSNSFMGHDGVSAAYGAMHPMFYSHPTAAPWGNSAQPLADKGENLDQSGRKQSQVHPQGHRFSHHTNHHRHHHHFQHHHHYQCSVNFLTQQQDEQTVTNIGTGAPHCGSSNIPEGNNGHSGSSNGYGSNGNGNGSVNGSAVGSNNPSNGHNGQSGTGLSAGGNGDSGTKNGNAGAGSGNCLTTGTVGSGVVVATDQNRVARREAALTKFRQKRKERCFEKKVRYQSRKRLAEQRPRVRGQFVRQSVFDSTVGEHEKDL